MVILADAPQLNGSATGQLSPTDALLLVADDAMTFRSPDGQSYAKIPVDERLEVVPLNSHAFRDWLLDRCRSQIGGELPSAYAIGRVLRAIQARAVHRGRPAGLRARWRRR